VHRHKVRDSKFDRLAGVRRNRRLRNFWMAVSGGLLLIGTVAVLDPVVSGGVFQWSRTAAFGSLFIVSIGIMVYYHLRFLSRE
jgi:hypothetical protein